jgi:hypothetical protein
VREHPARGRSADDLRGHVLAALRAAPGQHDDVAFLHSILHGLPEQVFLVGQHDGFRDRIPRLQGKRGDQVAVDVPDLAGRGKSARRGQLVPRGNDGHGKGRVDRRFQNAGSGQQSDFQRAEAGPLVQYHVLGRRVFPGQEHVAPGRDGFRDGDPDSREALAVFHHRHGVGALGQHPAGRDIGAGAGGHGAAGSFAHLHLAGERQEDRDALTRAEGVGGAEA